MIIFSSINLEDREYVGFHPSFSRHAIADASIALVIWLNENVVFFRSAYNKVITFSLLWYQITLKNRTAYEVFYPRRPESIRKNTQHPAADSLQLPRHERGRSNALLLSQLNATTRTHTV